MKLTTEEKRQNRIDRAVARFRGRYKWRAINEVATEFQKLRRLQSADEHGIVACVSCEPFNQAIGPWNQGFQGGHFVSRKSHKTLLDPRNVNVQCESCNDHGDRNGNVTSNYRNWMLANYGQGVITELESKRHEARPFGWEELGALLIDFRILVKIERKRVES